MSGDGWHCGRLSSQVRAKPPNRPSEARCRDVRRTRTWRRVFPLHLLLRSGKPLIIRQREWKETATFPQQSRQTHSHTNSLGVNELTRFLNLLGLKKYFNPYAQQKKKPFFLAAHQTEETHDFWGTVVCLSSISCRASGPPPSVGYWRHQL